MGLTGKFEIYRSAAKGGRKAVTFIITCDNLFRPEVFDASIVAKDGLEAPMIFRSLSLSPKKSFRFDPDSVGWTWCEGDQFLLIDSNGKIKQSWPIKFNSYSPGECPSCHGTGRCNVCAGKGYVTTSNMMLDTCAECDGSGQCMTCYIPRRSRSFQLPGTMDHYELQEENRRSMRHRQCENIRREIAELRSKIEREEWDLRMMELKNMNVNNYMVYSSRNSLLFTYQRRLIDLESKLRQLENL